MTGQKLLKTEFVIFHRLHSCDVSFKGTKYFDNTNLLWSVYAGLGRGRGRWCLGSLVDHRSGHLLNSILMTFRNQGSV